MREVLRFEADGHTWYYVADFKWPIVIKMKDHAMTPTESAIQRVVPDISETPGGIDLNTSNGMQWKVSKDGKGVEMNVDPAMIQRMKREGVDRLSPVIIRMTPVTSIWPLVGLQAP